VEVRPARADDADALLAICLLTGDAGDDASALHSDPRLLGLVWAKPYLDVEPGHAFVAAVDEEVVGYVLGTPDSRAFEARAEAAYWPVQRERYPLGPRPGRTAADEDAVALIHRPPAAPAHLLARYPGHLHIDLLPAAQGLGLGRRLVGRIRGSLEAAGCRGIHVGVDPRNDRAAAFYRHLGFVDVDSGSGAVHLGLALPGGAGTGPR